MWPHKNVLGFHTWTLVENKNSPHCQSPEYSLVAWGTLPLVAVAPPHLPPLPLPLHPPPPPPHPLLPHRRPHPHPPHRHPHHRCRRELAKQIDPPCPVAMLAPRPGSMNPQTQGRAGGAAVPRVGASGSPGSSSLISHHPGKPMLRIRSRPCPKKSPQSHWGTEKRKRSVTGVPESGRDTAQAEMPGTAPPTSCQPQEATTGGVGEAGISRPEDGRSPVPGR